MWSSHSLELGCRTYVTCAQNGTLKNFLGMWHSLQSNFFLFNFFSRHTSDCVETVYELPLLPPNNTAIETFLYKSGTVGIVGYCRVVWNDTQSITHIISFINVIKSYSCRMDCGTICRAEFAVRHWARPSDVGCSQRVGLLRSPDGENVDVPLGSRLVVRGSMVNLRGCDW